MSVYDEVEDRSDVACECNRRNFDLGVNFGNNDVVLARGAYVSRSGQDFEYFSSGIDPLNYQIDLVNETNKK